MKAIDRLLEYLEENNIAPTRFEKLAGLSNGYLGIQKKRQADLGEGALYKILDNCREIDGNWLIKGKPSSERLADRLSDVIRYIDPDQLQDVADSFDVSAIELGRFTNLLEFPPHPFNFNKFLKEYPEFSAVWLYTGFGKPFNGEQEKSLQSIHDRTYRKKHPEYFPEYVNKEDKTLKNETHDNNLWEQIHFQNEQLKEKDAQIKKLLDILQKK